MDGKRVSIEFTHPLRANGTNDPMQRLMVSKLHSDDPLMLECYFYALSWMFFWQLNNFFKMIDIDLKPKPKSYK